MSQSRRNFLKIIGVGAGVAIATPVLAATPEQKPAETKEPIEHVGNNLYRVTKSEVGLR